MIATPTTAAAMPTARLATTAAAMHAVPLATLMIDGTPPAVGDPVEFTIRGTVASIDGDTAQITAETINDQPATAEGPMDPDAMSDQDVMAMAMEADKATKADY